MLRPRFLLNRRRALTLGAAGVVASGMPLCLNSTNGMPISAKGTQRAKSVLIVMLSGGPSQLDMLDPKPAAPAEIRGEFSAIDTSIPGIAICEHLPGLAAQMDRWAILRTMAHVEHNRCWRHMWL